MGVGGFRVKKYREIAFKAISANMANIYILILQIDVGYFESKINGNTVEIDALSLET